MLSALLNSASRCTVAESSDASGEIRKSRRTWLTRSGETMRRCDDCPTSVLSVSATLDPSQPRLSSADALRNGRMASETAGPAAAFLAGANNSSRSRKPVRASTKTADAANPVPGDGLPPGLFARGEAQRGRGALALPGLKIEQELRGGLVAHGGIALQALADDIAEGAGNRPVVIGDRNGLFLVALD